MLIVLTAENKMLSSKEASRYINNEKQLKELLSYARGFFPPIMFKRVVVTEANNTFIFESKDKTYWATKGSLDWEIGEF